MKFDEMDLPNWLKTNLKQLRITHPTEIQTAALPDALNKKNILANAMTGTGKTMLYLLPIMKSLHKDPIGIHSLILSPSRELARSLQQQFSFFASKINARVQVITGGEVKSQQLSLLDAIPHILICTPGRLSDLLSTSPEPFKFFRNLKFLVLDEFDRLLDPTLLFFIQDILKKIFTIPSTENNLDGEKEVKLSRRTKFQIPISNVQVILTTATFEENSLSLKDLQKKFLFPSINIKTFNLNKQLQVVKTVKQYYLFFPLIFKDFYFARLIFEELKLDLTEAPNFSDEPFAGRKIIVFFNQCKTCHYWYKVFKALGLKVSVVHSYLKQFKRTANLMKFISNQTPILLATDLASRGLDLKQVHLIVNYDLPKNPKGKKSFFKIFLK